MDLDTILPLSGLHELPFGCDIGKVESILGAPSRKVEDDDGDVTLVYQEHALTFTFWHHSGLRLGAITSERRRMRLGEMDIVGRTENAISALVADVMHAALSERDGCIHEDGTRQTWLEANDLSTTFWFHENRLYLVDWGVGWKNEDEPAWPGADAAEQGDEADKP